MNQPRRFTEPHPRPASEQCRDVRARAWAFVFQCQAKKKAAGVTSTNGDDAMKGPLKHEDRANSDYTGT
jgi:hypothetical protein